MLPGNNQRNVESTPSLSSISLINTSSRTTTVQNAPQPSSSHELSVSSYVPSSDDGTKSINQDHIIIATHSFSEPRQTYSSCNNDQESRELSFYKPSHSNIQEVTPKRASKSGLNDYSPSMQNEISSNNHGNGENDEHIEGACANYNSESYEPLDVKDKEELQSKRPNNENGHKRRQIHGHSFNKDKSFDAETDNVVTEYTTIVVGKVFQTNDFSDDADATYNEDDQTIYASLEHLNQMSSNSLSAHNSLSTPFKTSPSDDIQKEFEKDFCSVEEALGVNDQNAEIKASLSTDNKPNDEKSNNDGKDLENLEGVRITINFDDDSDSQLLKYNNELAAISSSNMFSQDETDCDLIMNATDSDTDVKTFMQASDPPNRTITIIGSEPRETGSCNDTTQNVQSIDSNEGQSAITLEIDTSTSVI